MARYPLGQPVYVNWTIKDRNGTLVDPTAQTLTVQNPDLTLQTFTTPTHDSTGTFHQDIAAAALTQLGHYQWYNLSTGTGAGVVRGEFDVFDPLEPVVLSLADAKDMLNIPQATTTYDNEIQPFLDTITTSLEAVTGGPAYNRTISERVEVSHGYQAFVLRKRPLVSVTSITDIASGGALPLADIDPDLTTGVVRRKLQLPFFSWGPYYQVVYVAGWGTVIPAAFTVAARIIMDHLWQTQRGPSQHPMAGMDETFLPGMSYAIPNRALEVMRPFSQEAYI